MARYRNTAGLSTALMPPKHAPEKKKAMTKDRPVAKYPIPWPLVVGNSSLATADVPTKMARVVPRSSDANLAARV